MKVEARSDVALALEVRGLWVELGKRAIVSTLGSTSRPAVGSASSARMARVTTLVRGRRAPHHTGSVWGRPFETRGRRERARTVALVPQLPAIPESFTVEQYVLLGRTPHLGPLASEGARDLEAVATALERLDLGWAASRRLDSLSGGGRAVLARAIAQEAPLLLLDEPTTGLDIAQQLRVLELVDELRRADGLTVVSTMHDLTLAGRFAHRFALLSGGRLVAEGPRSEVLLPHVIAEHYGARVGVIDDGTLGWAVVPLSGSDA
jgi:iron complex transport system ATP-binding protein